jgi:hypothetical protein
MIQEIVTYLIVAVAVGLTFYKIFGNRFRKQNKKNLKTKSDHKCADCSAECVLRDTAIPIFKLDEELCKKIKV